MALFRELYLVRIASAPVARFHSGFGDLSIPVDIVEDDADAVYLGAGELVEVPDFQQLINGTAERLEFVLSGVSAEVLRLALEDAPSVAGARVDLGRLDLDADWQPIAPVEWEQVFEARSLAVSSAAGENRTRTIKLTIVSGETTRSRAPAAYFTDADQKVKAPTDRIFEFVSLITTGTSRRFGPK